MTGRCAAVAALVVLAMAGCGKREARPSAAPAATRPATAPTTRPAAVELPVSRPSSSTLNIAGRDVVFAPARAVVEEGQDGVEVTLFSDNPEDKDDVDRYSLPFHLDVSGIEGIDGADVTIKSAGAGEEDSPDGVVLESQRKLLRPYAYRAKFARHGGMLTIAINGFFLMSDMEDEAKPAQAVRVQGNLVAVVEEQK